MEWQLRIQKVLGLGLILGNGTLPEFATLMSNFREATVLFFFLGIGVRS
jgi:hypothetical protein